MMYRRRRLWSGVVALVLGLPALHAQASGDGGVDPAWKLVQKATDQEQNQAFLNPSNDNQVNLLLLLLDEGRARLKAEGDEEAAAIWSSAAPVPYGLFATVFDTTPAAGTTETRFAVGEASRCISNDPGAADFQAALMQAAGLAAAERDVLSGARRSLSPSCGEGSETRLAPLDMVTSSVGREFVAYLAGASAFYDGRFPAADEAFAAVGGSGQPWLKDAAAYMLGRVALNLAQASAFDRDDGTLKREHVDATSLANAAMRFEAYLLAFPTGRYAASARGLMRRIAWLRGDFAKLSAELTWQMDHLASGGAVDLASEVDHKLFANLSPATSTDPRLLAMWDLVQIRRAIPSQDAPEPFALATLQGQKASFAGHEDLFAYLLAAHAFHVDRNPAAALALLPATPSMPRLTLAAFSSEVLRGLALEATGDGKAARATWLGLVDRAGRRLQRPIAMLGLALNYERAGEVDKVFARGSPIIDPALREILLQYSASAGVLRRVAAAADATPRERAVALSTLLQKDLATRHFRAFLEDVALVPTLTRPVDDGSPDPAMFEWAGAEGDYACPGLSRIAKTLARTPRNTSSLLCLGEFLRLKGIGDLPPLPPDELGGAPSRFAGRSFSRQAIYQEVIADARASPNDRAYALSRAIRCYEPTGNNHCDGADVPLRERTRWFRILKAGYPKSEWSKIPYYW